MLQFGLPRQDFNPPKFLGAAWEVRLTLDLIGSEVGSWFSVLELSGVGFFSEVF